MPETLPRWRRWRCAREKSCGLAAGWRYGNGQVLGPAERISVPDALHAVSIEAALQNVEETRRDSVGPGKLADFVVLA